MPQSADRKTSTAWLDALDGMVEASDCEGWDARQALLRMGIMDAARKGGPGRGGAQAAAPLDDRDYQGLCDQRSD